MRRRSRSPSLQRREMLRMGLGAMGLIVGAPRFLACTPEEAPVIDELGRASNIARIGPLGDPDDNGLRLPPGFRSRIIAQSGELVAGTDYEWHHAPDGGAVFATPDGGWIYVSNSEIDNGEGGVGAMRFDAEGRIVDAYRICAGGSRNCAGGATPWGTWLSGEETETGVVWECDPFGAEEARFHPALGVFRHEAACVEPEGGRIYLTEDQPDGRFYRFTAANGLPDLSAGLLEVLELDGDEGVVRWVEIPDPSASSVATRHQVPTSKAFDGGEGLWYRDGIIYFTSKGDNRVWALAVAEDRLSVLYDDDEHTPAVLTGVDNLTMGPLGNDLLVAEDDGDMQIVALTSENTVVPLVQIEGHALSEITGPAFDPSGNRLYFSSQRGELLWGITYEVRGPFFVTST